MLRLLFVAVAVTVHCTVAFSPVKPSASTRVHFTPSSTCLDAMTVGSEGCAAKPFDKKKIAVFGAGGYLGAIVFGFLQRASSLYGTGIAGGSSPRAIGATRTTSEALNKVLTPCFKLAYAGEDLVRLVDSTNKDYIKERLKSFDAAILGTVYQLEERTVTGNTYEKTPNDRTFDFYLDNRYGACQEGVPGNDSDYHVTMFEAAVQACKESQSIQHLVVLETPQTQRPMDFISILEREGMKYTYIRAKQLKKDTTYSFEKGIKEKLNVALIPKGSAISPYPEEPRSDEMAVFREDVAALMVQSLMMLNWKESRIMEVSATSENIGSTAPSDKKSKQRFDKDWCPNSQIYAEILATLK